MGRIDSDYIIEAKRTAHAPIKVEVVENAVEKRERVAQIVREEIQKQLSRLIFTVAMPKQDEK